MRVNKEDFLNAVESVQPGVATREKIEQSSAVTFRNGEILSFNDEVFCRCPSGLPETYQGAVKSSTLVNLLRRLPDESIDVEFKEQMIITGKRKESGLDLEAELSPHLDSVEQPEEWTPLHEEFIDALALVQECAGKDQMKFYLTCVHLTPKWLEATDNLHMARYRLKTGLKGRCLVAKDSIKHVVTLGATHFCEGESWMHFKGPAGLVLSCRRQQDVEQFRSDDMTRFFEATGEPIKLPKGLAESTETAEIFSSENADDNAVMVSLSPGKIEIKGQGVTGWYKERKKISYSGPALTFTIGPALLVKIVKDYNEAEVSDSFLKVTGGKWTYLSCLGRVE
jgi:hypothetical protein